MADYADETVKTRRRLSCATSAAEISPLLPRRLRGSDIPRLGTRLQVGNAPALGGGTRPSHIPAAPQGGGLHFHRRLRTSRGTAFPPQHDFLVREDGAPGCGQNPVGCASIRRGIVRAAARHRRYAASLRAMDRNGRPSAAEANARTYMAHRYGVWFYCSTEPSHLLQAISYQSRRGVL